MWVLTKLPSRQVDREASVIIMTHLSIAELSHKWSFERVLCKSCTVL